MLIGLGSDLDVGKVVGEVGGLEDNFMSEVSQLKRARFCNLGRCSPVFGPWLA